VADFEPAVAVVLEHEGGFSDDARDAGGATKYGISLRWLTRCHLDLDGDGAVDRDDVIQLTVEQAKRIYRVYFWDPNGYARFVHQVLATKVFDLAVHTGAWTAHRLLQKAQVKSGYPVTVDGICGPLTVHAANEAPPDILLGFLCLEQGAFYRRLIKQRPAYAAFRKTWLSRARWPLGSPAGEEEKETLA
jgi:lysozyme family protein